MSWWVLNIKYTKSFIKQTNKQKNGNTQFTFSHSTAKTVIDLCKYGLDKSFQEVLYGLDNRINEWSSWTIEYIDGEYVNISIHNPLSGSTDIELLDELKHPKKDWLILKAMAKNAFFGAILGI